MITKSSSLNPVKTFSAGMQLAKGKWRLFWNFCPECNSYAPRIHSCDVCNCDTKSFFHWNKDVANLWWKKYVAKHGITKERLSY